MIHEAVEDWRKITEGALSFPMPNDARGFIVHKDELLDFFWSEWFTDLVDILGMDAQVLLEKIGIQERPTGAWQEPDNTKYWYEVRKKRLVKT